MTADKIRTCFRLNGGIGTYLMQENFMQYFYEKFSDTVSVTVYGAASNEINDGLFAGQAFVEEVKLRREFDPKSYDLAVDINWFPDVVHINKKKIHSTSIELEQVIDRWVAFKKDRRTAEFVRLDSLFDPYIYSYTIACGKNRVNITDIDGLLGVLPEFKLTLLSGGDEKILQKFGLHNQRYITMQQGVNINSLSSRSPKQWPTDNYSRLCALLKERHSDIVLVQLGESANNVNISGVDQCLLGQTSFEDLKVLLKHAVLHIDGECGMVHMRRALHAGPSVVLFGQTPLRVYGHTQDINLTANVCGDGCSKLFSAWKRRCYLSDEPLCMKALTPEYVAGVIDDYLTGTYRFPEKRAGKLQELLADESIKLDQEWVEGWLGQRTIYAYWLEKIEIKDLSCTKLTPDGYVKVPVTEMPAYKYMEGDRQSYVDYMALNDRYNPGHEHSLARFEKLAASFQDGFDQECYISVDGNNVILDGAHRACWLAHQYGPDKEITVLKIYGDWNVT